MKADLTRDSFAPQKHFSRVLMQQGRVQLDADWNEQAAILVAATRQLAVQVVPDNGSSTGAFALTPIAAASAAAAADLEIAPGVFWLDGIACEAAATPVAVLSASTTGLAVARWTVDGLAYAVGQRVRLSSPSTSEPSDVIALTGVDYATQTLVATAPEIPAWTPPQDFVDVRRILTYLTQPDLPHPPALPQVATQMVLHAWERLVTPLEDDSIREPALGEADTADRARIVWQVQALPSWAEFSSDRTLTGREIGWFFRGGYPGTLRARVQPAPASTDPCTVMPGSPYRGAENQLYRVEVNTGSLDAQGKAAAPTFKWSRDNGAVIFGVKTVQVAAGLTTVKLASLGPDERFGLAVGDYVEIADDETALKLLPGQLLPIQSIDRANKIVVLAGAVAVDGAGRLVGTDPTLHPLLRRWDHGGALPAAGAAADGCIAITQTSIQDGDGAWTTLEDGIQVLFDKFNPLAAYRTGDYWLLPARVATADVIWPQESALDAQGNPVTWAAARVPDGIDHHYAPLGVYDPSSQPLATAGQAKKTAPAKKANT